MTAMSTTSTKLRPHPLAPVRKTGDPRLNSPFWRSGNTGSSCLLRDGRPPKWEGAHFHRELSRRQAFFPVSVKRTAIQSP